MRKKLAKWMKVRLNHYGPSLAMMGMSWVEKYYLVLRVSTAPPRNCGRGEHGLWTGKELAFFFVSSDVLKYICRFLLLMIIKKHNKGLVKS